MVEKWSYKVQGEPPWTQCRCGRDGECQPCRAAAVAEIRDASEFAEGVNAAISALRQKAGEVFAEGGRDAEAQALRMAAEFVLAETRDWRRI